MICRSDLALWVETYLDWSGINDQDQVLTPDEQLEALAKSFPKA